MEDDSSPTTATPVVPNSKNVIRRKHRAIPLSEGSSSSSSSSSYDGNNVQLTSLAEGMDGDIRIRRFDDMVADYHYEQNLEMVNNGTLIVPDCTLAKGKLAVSNIDTDKTQKKKQSNPKERKERELDTSLSSSSFTKEQLEALHTRQLKIIPWALDAFNGVMDELPQATYYDADGTFGQQATQDVMQKAMRVGRLNLPILTAQHESLIYAQSGTFPSPVDGSVSVYPPCRKGIKCLAYTNWKEFPGLTEPIILTAVMFPNEMNNQSANVHISRLCIACSRFLIVDCALAYQELCMTGGGDAVQPTNTAPYERKAVGIVQFYGNLYDRKGGYMEEYTIRPTSQQPHIQPLARLNLSKMTCFKDDKEGGRWRVDQSRILWVPPTIPNPGVGQTMQSF